MLASHGVEWFYRAAPKDTEAVSSKTHHCKDGYLHALRRLDSERRFARYSAVCHPGGDAGACAESLFATHALLTNIPARRFVEVTHLAYNSKLTPHHTASGSSSTGSWSKFLDTGRSGWWFTHAPGSGIWYDAGTTCCKATFKNTLMIDLLTTLLSRRLAPPCLSARGLGLCPNVSHFLYTVKQTRRAPCAKWLHCRDGYVLDDTYDPLLMDLGRIVGCDSLFLTASPLVGMHGAFIGELVDLRPPSDGPPFNMRHSGYFSEAVAVAWVAEYQARRRLTLRDPLAPLNESRAAPCTLPPVPTLRLACTNHISWSARNEPDKQNWCMKRTLVVSQTRSTSSPRRLSDSITARTGSATRDCAPATAFERPMDCRRGNSSYCRWPFGFLPYAYRLRGTAVSAAQAATSDTELGWSDNSFVEVAHTSVCGGDHCDHGIWFHTARGCSGLLWNVGRSLRAMNKMHAHAVLVGEDATCAVIRRYLHSVATVPGALNAASFANKREVSNLVRWLAAVGYRNGSSAWHAGCRQWIAYFSTRSYGLKADGGSHNDPFNMIGSGLFDDAVVMQGNRIGYSSVQLLLQPGGGAHGYTEAGGTNLETELIDVRDTRFACEIEADLRPPVLQHIRARVPVESRLSGAEADLSQPCEPTSSFFACMACEGIPSGCKRPGARNAFKEFHQRRVERSKRLAQGDWMVRELGDANSTFVVGLSIALSGCPLAQIDVQDSILRERTRLTVAGCPSTPCDVVRAVRSYPTRQSWPYNVSACGTERRRRLCNPTAKRRASHPPPAPPRPTH